MQPMPPGVTASAAQQDGLFSFLYVVGRFLKERRMLRYGRQVGRLVVDRRASGAAYRGPYSCEDDQ
jgi:hypothetical protein